MIPLLILLLAAGQTAPPESSSAVLAPPASPGAIRAFDTPNDAGKSITLNRDNVPPGDLIDEALITIRDKVRSGIQVTTSCNGVDTIYCDREYIRLSLINLIVNAIQSIADSGQVRIECGEENGMVCLAVSDTGQGIPADELERIFEPYYSTKKLGIGLGLAITKRFVEEHGGTISAVSEVGKGTTMTIRLPRNEG